MFRIEFKIGLIFRRFYNEEESNEPIPHSSKLFNDAFLYGNEIDKEQYFA